MYIVKVSSVINGPPQQENITSYRNKNNFLVTKRPLSTVTKQITSRLTCR
jgi:hypothetical protein